MTAVHIAEMLDLIVVLGEEQRRVSTRCRVLVEQLVHRLQKKLGLVKGDRALTAKIGLQIRHQQRRRDPLTGDIANHKPEPLAAKVEEIVIVAADLSRLHTRTGIVEGANRGK